MSKKKNKTKTKKIEKKVEPTKQKEKKVETTKKVVKKVEDKKEEITQAPKEIIKNPHYKKPINNKNKERIYSISCILLILDQLIKIIIKTKMHLSQEIVVIPKFFSLLYVENEGAAFSILTNKSYFLILVSVICLYLVDKYITVEKDINKLSRISLGLIIGGMLGNLIDRILYKKVVDYLSFTFGSYSFAIFNLADIGITIGVFLLIYQIIKDDVFHKKLVK